MQTINIHTFPASVGRAFRLFVVAATLLACRPLFAQEPSNAASRALGTEMKKLHALLVIDTEDADLKESVSQDRHNMETVLTANIPEPLRGKITVLEGKNATKQNVLDYYRKLPLVPSETLLFFYAGHGAIDTTRGDHFLQLQAGKDPLFRKDVIAAMKAKNPGLMVLLTDCCSVKTRLPTKLGGRPASVPRDKIHPVLHCLLFQHKGLVDITAAQDGTGSWGDKNGGIFTRSLSGLLSEDLNHLDTNKDQFITWKEFFGHLERKTEETYEKFCETVRAMDSQDIKKTQRSQKPRSFSPFPEPLNNPKTVQSKTYAVVSLVNKRGKTIDYRYRWHKTDEWKDGKLEKDGKVVYELPIKASMTDSQLPHLEMEIASEKVRDLPSRKWTGTGKPKTTDGQQTVITSTN